MNSIIWLMTVIALSVGIVRYLIGAIIRIQFPGIGVVKDWNYHPSLSILLPAFNEGPAVTTTIKSISESNYAGKIEIIVTDDCSVDGTADAIAHAAHEFPNLVRAFYNKPNLGKTQTILNALARSTSDLVMIVDSDTVLGKDCIRSLAACLGDPRLGAVGAPAIVRNPEGALGAFQTFIYFLGFQIYKEVENARRCVGVIGGYAFMLRREAFEQLRPALEARNWWGVIVKDGEDRFITHQLLMNGWGTYMDSGPEALCLTSTPTTFTQYWNQQLRWRRTTLRDFFFSVRRMSEHLEKLGAFSLYVYILTPVVLFISIIQVSLLFTLDPMSWLAPDRVAIFFLYAFIVIWFAKKFTPDQTVRNPLLLLVYSTWWVVNSLLLAVLALMTLDAGDWASRNKKKLQEKS